jgi:hypothetical protein
VEWTPYYTVLRLLRIAADHWASIDGEAGVKGDPLDLPFDRFLNHIQHWAVTHTKDPQRLLMDLEKPPPHRLVTADDLDEDAKAFTSFASMFGVRVPAPAVDDDVASESDE